MSAMPGADWVVLKFGGTSVADRPCWDTIARLAETRVDAGHRVVLVCSAVAGVTDDLEALADCAEGRHGSPLSEVLARYRTLAEDLGVDAEDLLSSSAHEVVAAVDRIHRAANAGERAAARAEVLASGEWLTTQIGARFLGARMACTWVDARDALDVMPEHPDNAERAWMSARCSPGVDMALQQRWLAIEGVLITQGFVARGPGRRTALLGRGGSDTSAALLAGRLDARRVEIWTDVRGVYSADPRRIDTARLIPVLDVGEALELAAGGARVVHPRALHAAAATATPVWVRDTAHHDASGTDIVPAGDDSLEPGDALRAVTRQHDTTVLLLENRDIRQQVGFLARVFEIVAEHGVSIDLVATSETTTTLSFQRHANHLDDAGVTRLVDALREGSRVTVYPRAATVNLVGRGVRRALSRFNALDDWLANHPVLMVSLSANDRGLSILVPEDAADELERRLHDEVLDASPGVTVGATAVR